MPCSDLTAAASSATPAGAAAAYHALGLSVLPLRGKVPAVRWRAYQQRRPTDLELANWLRRGLFQNVGIVCGPVSDNLVVLDFDDPARHADFCRRFPALTHTYTVQTGGGGWHLYLRAEADTRSSAGPGVEIRAARQQVAAPPSIHPVSRQPYTVALAAPVLTVPDLLDVTEWAHMAPQASWRGNDAHRAPSGHDPISTTADPALVAALTDHFRGLGYRRNGDWLNGPCIYPDRHAHADAKRSFGFNVRSGYGFCFRCGSMTAKEISNMIGEGTTSRPSLPPALR